MAAYIGALPERQAIRRQCKRSVGSAGTDPDSKNDQDVIQMNRS